MQNESYAGMAENKVKVEKTGVYRDKETGHAIRLSEGHMVAADTMDRYEYDGKASESAAKRAEGRTVPRLGGIIDAPPPIEERRMPPPSNKMSGPDRNKSAKPTEQESDANLAPSGKPSGAN
jgi:hypothetical protein